MKILNNRRGMAYVLTCVIVLVAMMMLSALFRFAYIFSVIHTQKDSMQMKLDSVVIKSAVENYDALKQGTVYDIYMDYTGMEQEAYVALGFSNADVESVEDALYTMNRPQITTIAEGGFGLLVTYDLVIPFEIWGQSYGDITVPITLTSKFTEK